MSSRLVVVQARKGLASPWVARRPHRKLSSKGISSRPNSVFLIPATTQMTFKLYNPHTKKTSWKSVNVNGFKHDGCSSKSDAFVSDNTMVVPDGRVPFPTAQAGRGGGARRELPVKRVSTARARA